MRKEIRFSPLQIWLGLALVVVSLGLQLDAQQYPSSTPQEQQPQQQPPPSAQTPDESPSPASQTQQSQTFSGMIVKSGDKYMLKDSDSGVTYDIDRQDLAKAHEGKKVQVLGTLDPNGKLIHVK